MRQAKAEKRQSSDARRVAPLAPVKGAAWMPMGMLLVLVGLVFWRVSLAEFLTWDDLETVALNPKLNPVSAENVAFYWGHPHMSLWVPLTYSVWGILAAIAPRVSPNDLGVTLDPAMFHVANLVIHACSACVVLQVLRRLFRRDWPAFFGAALFALHPVQVESVAWMSGLKDVMAGMLGLLSLLLLLLADEVRFDVDRFTVRMIGATAAFVAAMLSKPSAVVWPLLAGVVLGVFLQRRLQPDRKSYLWLAGWLVLTIPILIIGRWVQPAMAVKPPPFWERPFVAGDAIAFYLAKLFWPMDLRFDYGRRLYWLLHHGPTIYLTTLASAALLALAIILRKRAGWFTAAVGIFMLAPLPVLGFVSFEFQYFSTVADHYQYVAMLGPAMIVTAIGSKTSLRWFAPVAGAIVCALAVLSYRQVKVWNNSAGMYQHLFAIDPRCESGFYIAARDEKRKGNIEKSLDMYRKALEVAPDHGRLYYDYGNTLVTVGRFDAAEQAYRKAIEHGLADDPDTQYMLGVTMAQQHRFSEAEQQFERVLQLDPAHRNAISGLQKLQQLKVPAQ